MSRNNCRLVSIWMLGLCLVLSGCRYAPGADPQNVRRHGDGGPQGAVAVAADERHSMALQADGTVVAWGWNDGDQMCGHAPGRYPSSRVLRMAGGGALDGGRAVSLGNSHAVVLKRDGTAWSWGDNTFGQIGTGDRKAASSPVAVKGSDGQGNLSNLVAVAAGKFHTVALQRDGSVWAWGHGNSGQLGATNAPRAQTAPIQVSGPDGRGWLSHIRAIAAGRAHTVALATDGTVWGWGDNRSGQLGDGTKTDRHTPVQVVGPDGSGALTGIVAIAASPLRRDLTVALGADGSVWTWGENSSGQLGNEDFSLGRSVPGRVVGPDGQGALTGIIDIAVGGAHVVALRGDGTLWGWGDNRFGQLGDGTTANRALPVRAQLTSEKFTSLAAGDRHCLAVRANGSVVAWGNDWYGQLGKQAIDIPAQRQPPGRSADGGQVLWTTASRLMPQWGFYPNGQSYGGVKPIDGPAAWTLGENTIVWVPDIPSDGRYHLWIRKVYGTVEATIDEQPLAGARGGPGGNAFAWRHHGSLELTAGTHHVDIRVQGQCVFDAVLLTTSDRLNPNTDSLPGLVEQPATQVPRRYRDDAPLRAFAVGKPFVTGRMPLFDAHHLNDWVPSTNDVLRTPLQLWGAANQYVSGSFGIRALEALPDLEVAPAALNGPGGRKIESQAIDVRVVHLRNRAQLLFAWPQSKRLTPELLLRDDRISSLPPTGAQGGFGHGVCRLGIPRGESRQVWLTINVASNLPPGLYTGDIRLKAGETVHLQPMELEVLPLDLRPVDGYYSIYHPVRPVSETSNSGVPESRYRAELEDMVRHGLNTVSLYGGFETLRFARDAGMTQAPCIMGWPGGRDSLKQVEAAKAMGFTDLLYYGVDEPNTPEDVARCRREAERRRKIGLKTLTAISAFREAWEGLKDVVDYPVLIINSYGGKDGSEPAYARERGHCPISYWMTSCTFPTWFRANTGLYNRACGFQGTMPWSYTDYTDPMQKYDPDGVSHQVTYPDEAGLPIPTLQWEAYRAGIDDVRYLQALDRSIAAGQERLARPSPPEGLEAVVAHAIDVRKRDFESVADSWFRYLIRTQSADLDAARRAFAEATMNIEATRPRW